MNEIEKIMSSKQLKAVLSSKAIQKYTDMLLENEYKEFYQLEATENEYKLNPGDKIIANILCPITGEELILPTRSITCKHYECIEFENFLYSVMVYK